MSAWCAARTLLVLDLLVDVCRCKWLVLLQRLAPHLLLASPLRRVPSQAELLPRVLQVSKLALFQHKDRQVLERQRVLELSLPKARPAQVQQLAPVLFRLKVRQVLVLELFPRRARPVLEPPRQEPVRVFSSPCSGSRS